MRANCFDPVDSAGSDGEPDDIDSHISDLRALIVESLDLHDDLHNNDNHNDDDRFEAKLERLERVLQTVVAELLR